MVSCYTDRSGKQVVTKYLGEAGERVNREGEMLAKGYKVSADTRRRSSSHLLHTIVSIVNNALYISKLLKQILSFST
jgi:hypothetical protein